MAIQTGNIKYRGSFKNIRQYMNLHDPNSYAGEKGGANGDLIKNNPAFARTRENMNEFNGCGLAVKAIRHGLMNLLPEQTDKKFTGRLMKLVKSINVNDAVGSHGKRAIAFSSDRPLLKDKFVFNLLQTFAIMLKNFFTVVHPISRAEATLTVTALAIKKAYAPKTASHYRVLNHLSIISDYEYSEANRSYEPLSSLNTLSAFTYSEYTPIETALTHDLVASFPVGTVLTDDVSVIQVVGIEFYLKSGATDYLPLQESSMFVIDVF